MSHPAFEEIAELTDIYYRKISGDHHKSKDCYFSIECHWTSWDDPVIPKFQAIHNGYINELKAPERNTFEEAVEDLHDFLIESIAEYVREEDMEWI